MAERLEDQDLEIRWGAIMALEGPWNLPEATLNRKAAQHEDLEDRDLNVRRAAIDALRSQSNLPEEIIKQIAARLEDLEDRDLNVRRAAIAALRSQSNLPEGIINQIAARLEDQDRGVRWGAIDALRSQLNLPEGIINQIASRLEHQDRDVRRAAIDALKSQSNLPEGIINQLAARLEHQEQDVRRAAIDVLNSQSNLSEWSLKQIAARLEDQDYDVRWGASDALKSQPNLPEGIINQIASRLENQDPVVRWGAIDALRSQSNLPEVIINQLAARLEDQDRGVRWGAIDALRSQLNLPEGIINQIASRLEHQDRDVRRAAIDALKSQSNLSEWSLNQIAARLEDQDRDIRRAAIDVLNSQSNLSEWSLKQIAARLEDQDRDIRRAAIDVLNSQSNLSEWSLNQIAARLEDQDWDVRRAAIDALRSQSNLPEGIINQVATQLEHQEQDVRRAAIDVLNSQSNLSEWPLNQIAARLEHQDRDVRWGASDVLRSQSNLPEATLKQIATRLEDQDWDFKRAAIGALRSQSNLPEGIINQIAAQLEHQAPGVRRAASDVLRSQSNLPEATLNQVAVQFEYQDPGVRWAAIKSLGRHTNLLEATLNQIAARLEDQDCDVRRAAIDALRSQSNLPEGIINQIAAQLEHQDPGVRRAATDALGSQSNLLEGIINQIAARLKDQDRDVRWGAIDALRSQSNLPEGIINQIAAQLEDQDIDIRRATIDALKRQLNLPEGIINQIASRLEDQDRDVRWAAIDVLRSQSNLPEATLKQIATRLEDQDWDFKRAAIGALRSQSNLPEGIINQIAAQLEHQAPGVRRAASDVLRSQSNLPEATLKQIAARLEEQDWDFRRAAIDTLKGQSNLPEGITNQIAARLEHQDSGVRRAASDVLRSQSNLLEATLNQIAARLENQYWDVRRAAIDALRSQSNLPEVIINQLAARLEDQDRDVRRAAIDALRSQSNLPEGSLNQIAAQLKHQDPGVRRAASDALKSQSNLPEGIIDQIAARLEDQDRDVRRAAIDVLNSQSNLSEWSLNNIAARLEDQDRDVRWGAIYTLNCRSNLPEAILKQIAARLSQGHPSALISGEKHASDDPNMTISNLLKKTGSSTHPSEKSGKKSGSIVPETAAITSTYPWEISKDTKTSLMSMEDDYPSYEENLADDTSDMKTIYTEITDLHSASDYVSEIAQILLQHLEAELVDASALDRILLILGQWLKAFAIQLGHEMKSQEALHAMVFIRHYREHISESLRDMWYREREEKSAGDVMPYHEKMERYFATSPGDMEPPIPQHDLSYDAEPSALNYNLPPVNSGDRVNTHEPDANVGIAKRIDYQSLTQSQAFQWLLTRLQRELHLTTPQPDNLSIIREHVINVFHVNWDPQAFVKEQQYLERFDEAIATAITITGDPNCAQAITTTEYLDQTWPISGQWMLQVLKDMVLTGSGHFKSYGLQFSGSIHDARTIVEVCGTPFLIAEIGEQLAWFGSTLRSSHFDDGVAYCTPLIRTIHGGALPETTGDAKGPPIISYGIDFLMKQKGKISQEGICWHDLFRNPVAAEGFPIRRRPEHCTGLDIPLHIMAGLIRAHRATDFDERLFIKGFSSLLFPTKLVGDMMIWHLLFKEDGSHISYLDPRIKSLQVHEARGISLVHLASTHVHVLGWCSQAKSYAGTILPVVRRILIMLNNLLVGSSDAKYPIDRSECGKTHPSMLFDRFSITAGQYINIGASFSVGNKDKPLRLVSASSYDQQVLRMSEKFVLFYDVVDRRAWLVNGATALLHLVIASLKYEQSTPIGQKFLSKVEDLRKVGPQHRADSAIHTLIDEKNMYLPILPGKKRRVKEFENEGDAGKDKIEESNIPFRDRVEQVIDYLEKAFIYQEDKMCRSGLDVKRPFRRLLEGFDFAEIAESQSSVPRRIAELKVTGKVWIDFVRKIKAVALFGVGFGDIISPACTSCGSWSRMPTGEDYLAVRVHDLKTIIKKFGIRGQNQIVSGIFWHMPDKIFDDSACRDSAAVRCDHAQALLPIRFKFLRFSKRIVPLGTTLDGKEEGAVIFGNSKKLPLNIPEDPEEIAQEGQPTPESTITGGMKVETGCTALSSSQSSVSSTLLTSIRLGAGAAEGSSSAVSSSQERSQVAAALSDITIPNDLDNSDLSGNDKERQGNT
ncbi:hypothetical protein N7522_006887 [Penicillium canescens]|nr:hypothetical protein N7522_006887 [Penicillium canescens]